MGDGRGWPELCILPGGPAALLGGGLGEKGSLGEPPGPHGSGVCPLGFDRKVVCHPPEPPGGKDSDSRHPLSENDPCPSLHLSA